MTAKGNITLHRKLAGTGHELIDDELDDMIVGLDRIGIGQFASQRQSHPLVDTGQIGIYAALTEDIRAKALVLQLMTAMNIGEDGQFIEQRGYKTRVVFNLGSNMTLFTFREIEIILGYDFRQSTDRMEVGADLAYQPFEKGCSDTP